MSAPSRRLFLVLGMLASLMICSPLFAIDPSFEITRKCRENMKTLRDATLEFFKNEAKADLPTWAKFDGLYTMYFAGKYLKSMPTSPTPDCSYYLILKSRDDFEYYCELHGMPSGDQKITFRYHEYQFTGVINSKYLDNKKYKEHTERLQRWTRYAPTLMENIKFQYRKNPISTMVMVVFGLCFAFFVYKNIFGP